MPDLTNIPQLPRTESMACPWCKEPLVKYGWVELESYEDPEDDAPADWAELCETGECPKCHKPLSVDWRCEIALEIAPKRTATDRQYMESIEATEKDVDAAHRDAKAKS